MDIKDSKGCLFVGEGVTISGEISLPGAIFIDGAVNGIGKAKELFVGPTGHVTGDLDVMSADIRGTISQSLQVSDHLIVRSSGRIEGRLSYRSIEIERGGSIVGELLCVEKETFTDAGSYNNLNNPETDATRE